MTRARQVGSIVRRGGWLLAGLLGVLSGCASMPGSELTLRPAPSELRATNVLRLPADQKFSIHLAPSSREPGLAGQAQSESSATDDGQAAASASVSEGGKATAGFQLGHAFHNDTGQQLDLATTLRLSYAFDTQATPAAPRPEASVTLLAYVRDGRNRLLSTFKIVEHTTEQGAVSAEASRELQFSPTLAPGDTATIYLAGRIAIDTKQGHSAAGRLSVRDLTMQLEPKPAPPIPTAPAGQPAADRGP